MQEEELRGLNSRGKKLAEEEQRLRTDVRNTGSVKEDLRRMEQSLNRSTRKLRNSISAEDRNRADVQQKLREIDRLQNDAAAISLRPVPRPGRSSGSSRSCRESRVNLSPFL